ncbi:hypothetical protein J7E97_19455 [Streptomyces sp. ISL-66]|uniref:hypothetical protein n=1 Tax=Streptomyces sp. ISL-66 TaxID=2819186 RepID=UPI001BE87E1D|nr:hypothetical protein [Streptomyces sp. ISL-66]MBT2469991.1 hypothetical protein [Streptomyces sp. ISL-66]
MRARQTWTTWRSAVRENVLRDSSSAVAHSRSKGDTHRSAQRSARSCASSSSSENVSGPGYDSSQAHVAGRMASARGHRATILNYDDRLYTARQ